MSFPALAVECEATQHLPPAEEWDDEFGWIAPINGHILDIAWVIYQSESAGRLLRVRSVDWAYE